MCQTDASHYSSGVPMTPKETNTLMALTDRQKQISDMQKQGKKAPEIASALGITTNAVYQQIRRMRSGKDSSTTAKTGAKSGSKSGAKSTPAAAAAATPAPTPAAAPAARPMTPLQSLRARRDEITSSTKEIEQQRDAAKRELDKIEASLTKARERHADELARLDQAEAALTGKPVAGQPTVEPAAAKPQPTGKPASATTPRPKSGAKSGSKSGSKNGSSAASPAKGGDAPSEPAPAAQAAPQPAPAPVPATQPTISQAEREASADFDPAVSG